MEFLGRRESSFQITQESLASFGKGAEQGKLGKCPHCPGHAIGAPLALGGVGQLLLPPPWAEWSLHSLASLTSVQTGEKALIWLAWATCFSFISLAWSKGASSSSLLWWEPWNPQTWGRRLSLAILRSNKAPAHPLSLVCVLLPHDSASH